MGFHRIVRLSVIISATMSTSIVPRPLLRQPQPPRVVRPPQEPSGPPTPLQPANVCIARAYDSEGLGVVCCAQEQISTREHMHSQQKVVYHLQESGL